MNEIGVLMPLRIETRFKGGDLWVRVVPDEPWFRREDPRPTIEEVAALQRYVDAPDNPGAGGVPSRWQRFAADVGAPRAAFLHRRFVTTAPDGSLAFDAPASGDIRTEPVLPSIVDFPGELVIWIQSDGGLRDVLHLTVDRTRLLVDFADPDQPDDRRWWQDWDEAVAVGVAGVVPAAALIGEIDALYVTGLGDSPPVDLFTGLADEGRLGLLEPGVPTNSVDGAPAAALANDAATWWELLDAAAGESDRSVSLALTGDTDALGNIPGGLAPHRSRATALTTVLWPALWGFAATRVFDLDGGPVSASWAAESMFPQGAYPTLRIGPQPYGLLTTTAWRSWKPADGDPDLEAPLVDALRTLRSSHAKGARARGTASSKPTDGLLDLMSDTPTSSRFRFRHSWPLELWWLGMVGSGVPQRWRSITDEWQRRYRLPDTLGLRPVRRYGARGQSRLVGVPLVVPRGATPDDLPDLLGRLADAALESPGTFTNTRRVDIGILRRSGDSLLLRLAVRSIQVLLGDLGRQNGRVRSAEPEPFVRNSRQAGRLEQLIAGLDPIVVDVATPSSAITEQLLGLTTALRSLGSIPVAELERMLSAAIDCSSHRIDPWLTAVPQRRLDALTAAGARRRLGAYGWVDDPTPGSPGPTSAGLLHTPSMASAATAAVLRDRAISDDSDRWDLRITSQGTRVAEQLAEQVRRGAHLGEAVGREVERILGRGVDIDIVRRTFPLRQEHAGRRVCDGLQALAAEPFPVAVDAEQAEALQGLRDGLDTYSDLIVADAVHHLIDGRAQAAGAIMEGAAGLSRPPDLELLRTPREGRAVSTTVVLALAHVAPQPLPTSDTERALVSPTATLDPSTAAFIAGETGSADEWDFEVAFVDEDLGASPTTTVLLSDLGLGPTDALALTKTRLEALAVAAAADRTGVDLAAPGITGTVSGGTTADRYDHAVRLVALLGRTPAAPRDLSERAPGADVEDPPFDDGVLARYVATRDIGEALVRSLHAIVDPLGNDELPTTENLATLERLLTACRAWGVAPEVSLRPEDSSVPTPPPERSARRLVDTALVAVDQLDERVATSPDPVAASQLSVADLIAKALALASPTGQVAFTATVPASRMPAVANADTGEGLDAVWLTVTAAVRPALARLEAHQLTSSVPLAPWANRADDPWQTDESDARRLIVVYAPLSVELGAGAARVLAVASIDRFSEVVPSTEQLTGASFGFDAPAARAQQAILLAVPPVVDEELDHATLAAIVSETRELAHARMARPVDIDPQFWSFAPTGLFPASGSVAIPFEVQS